MPIEMWRIDAGHRVCEVAVALFTGGMWGCADGHYETTPVAAVRAWAFRNSVMGVILAPGEPTRAELAAQLAAVTAERDALADGAECVRFALLDVVRHITADPCDSDEALATPTARLVAVIDESADELRATIDRACEERDVARSALATARREGAEGMREACAERVRYLRGDLGAAAILRGESPVTPATEALSTAERLTGRLAVDDVIGDDDAIRALPLDAPGGAT